MALNNNTVTKPDLAALSCSSEHMALDNNTVTEPDLAITQNTLSTPGVNGQRISEKPTEEAKATQDLQRSYPSRPRRFTIVAALCLGTLLNAIDITIIGVAIPTISTVFDALDDVGWYGTAYLVTLTALQPIFGVTYKYFNPRIIYLLSVLLFEVGSVLSASATSSAIFIVGRAITGCGGAGVLQGALCIVALIVPLNKRALYLGIVVSSFGAAACFGPIMGGALTDHASWRWCFWINVPIGGAVAAIVILFLKLDGIDTAERRLPMMKRLRHLDPLGAALLMGSVCCLALALQWAGATLKWRSAKVIGLFVGFGLLGIAFFVFEWKSGDRAMLPLRVFGQRSILLGCFYVCFFQMINDSVTYYIPFYFQAAQGASATSSGAKFISLVLPEIIAIVVVAAVVGKIGQYISFMVSGACIAAVGIGLLTRITLGTSTNEWAAYMVISGLGIGLGINLPYTTLHVVLR